jgi:rare lipoprotein A
MKTPLRTLALSLGLVLAGTLLAQSPATPPTGSAPVTPSPSAPTAVQSGDNMEGLAAVYSDKLQGHKTASGQAFSQSKLTAAHPSLAFGTKVKVTNTKNNKTVEVRINDRGPTQAGRVIDMSSAAASKIGLSKKAMVPVKLEVVAEAPAKKSRKSLS